MIVTIDDAAQLWDEKATSFQKVCDSLNHFLITLCLQEAVMSAPCLAIAETELRLDMLPVGFEPLWVRGRYVQIEPSHTFYYHPGADILILDLYYYERWWIASHAARALASELAGVQIRRIH